MAHNGNQFHKLLAALKRYQFLTDYNLTLFCEKEGVVTLKPCCSIIQNRMKNNVFDSFLDSQVNSAFSNNTPQIYRCLGGYLRFVVPFRSKDVSFCLVGDGVREKSIDVWQLEEFSKRNKIDFFSLREELETLPATTFQEVQKAAGQVLRVLPALVEDKLYKSFYDRNISQLGMIVRVLPELDTLTTIDEIVSLSGEILGFLFNFPKIAIVLHDSSGQGFSMTGTWGLPEYLGKFPEKKVAEFTSPEIVKKTIRLDEEFKKLFPQIEAERAIFFPLKKEDELLGFIVLFDCKPHSSDFLLAELITDRIAAKIIQLKDETERLQAIHPSNKLISLQNSFLCAENCEDLYRNILEIASNLVNASRGSLMLLNESEKSLFIKFCKGMKPQIAQLVSVKLGEGISGHVAESGIPLLVNDIEKDCRVEMRNRPRFKTKSLLCTPLKVNGKVIGVLNLSDKEDLGVFTETDLGYLNFFISLATLMIERVMYLEKSVLFEKLSLTDPLTGLHNRRYLEERLSKEINRSNRQKKNFSIILIDIDDFKIYNDRHGHLLGDGALRKAADIINASVRDMDIVARYGGDEFCVILPDTSKKESLAIAKRIRQNFEKEKFMGGEVYPLILLTVSGGISSFPEDGTTFPTLIHAADVALYRAKEKGRNRIVMAHHGQRQDAV